VNTDKIATAQDARDEAQDRAEVCSRRLQAIYDIIIAVEGRCSETDGPVTPTTEEITEKELREIARLADPDKVTKEIGRRRRRLLLLPRK
jgi:hypothetical protein